MSEDCLVTQKSSGNASTAPPEIDNEDTGIKALLKELNQSAYEFTRPIKNNSGFVAECNNSSHTPTNAPSDEKQIVANINDDEDLMEYIREQLEYETCDLDHIVFELSSLIPTTFEANELNLLIHQYFDRTRSPGPDEERLDFAISIQELGVLFICDENSEKFRLLSNLGYSYKCRFKAHGQLDDIEQAIWNETQAVLLAGVDHMDLPVLLGNLGTSRWCRFERLGDAKDIEEAIKCQTQAVSLVPDDHPNIHTLLNDLGNSYHSRFESTGEPPDINMSIDCHRRAVSFALEEDEIWSARLNLGNSYRTRFESFGNIEDIEETISLQAQTVLIMTDNDPRKAEGLSNLGNSYWSRFKRIGRFEDINRAITYQKSATTLAPGGHFEQPPRLYYLGCSYGSRFERTGSLGDIEDAIACQSQAVELTPEGHRDKPTWLNALGIAYRRLFDRTGNIHDIDRAILCHTQAVSRALEGHADIPVYLTGLGNAYQSRFERLGELEDIDRAIEKQCSAVLLVSEDHTARPILLTSLGNSYLCRYKRLKGVPDIDQAVACQTLAVSLTPSGHHNLPPYLNNLGQTHIFRSRELSELEDAEKAISYLSQGADITPQGHAIKPSLLTNLGITHVVRFNWRLDTTDIEHAITYCTQASLLTPQDSTERPGFLYNLAAAYHARFKQLGETVDINRTIECYQEASQLPLGPPSKRYEAASEWAQLSVLYQVSSPLQAYEQVMMLIPQLIWLGTTISRRYHDIPTLTQLVLRAVAIAIEMRAYGKALEWLEQGRSIVWNQILQLRTPMDALRAIDPSLAKRFEDTAYALEQAGTQKFTGFNLSHTELYTEEMSQRHRHLAQEWAGLIDEARSHSQLCDFLSPMKAATLIRAAQQNTVVIINIDEFRCDALALVPGSTTIMHIPLPALSRCKATEIHDNLLGLLRGVDVRACSDRRPVFQDDDTEPQFESMLATLWNDVAQPVLDSLGYLRIPGAGDHLPHVTWCTTGPLAFLPLHAAGCYDKPYAKVFDFVISSYTPTLSALLAGSRSSNEFRGILAVGQATTHGCEPLPGTISELVQIEKQAKTVNFTKLEGDAADATRVLTEMENHSWVHLACHASQSSVDPTASAFLLHDSKLDLLAIMRKSLKHGQFAFLSACQTASGDGRMPEEAVHLAAGMIVAGYPTVIATMWSIKDDDAPVIAKEVYAHLLEDGVPNSSKAAEALHNAVACLRDKVGEKAFARWVPYIHLGL